MDQISPVLRSEGRDLTNGAGGSFVMLGVEPESFNTVSWSRKDFANKPIANLLKSLRASDPPRGIVLPEDARTIAVRLQSDRPHPTVRLTARIMDAEGRYFTYSFGNLNSSGWTVMETSLRIAPPQFRSLWTFSTVRRQSREHSLPLTLVSLAVHETGAGRPLKAGRIAIDEIRVATEMSGESGVYVPVETFDSAAQWSLLRATPEAASDVFRLTSIDEGGDGYVIFAWFEGNPMVSRGIFHGTSRSPLPVLASRSFVNDTGHARGEEFEVSISGHRMPVRLVDIVDLFPTMTSFSQRFLVADLISLVKYANLGGISDEFLPNEVWIESGTSGVDRQHLIHMLESDEVFLSSAIHDREPLIAESRVDPLVGAGWRAMLFVAFSAVLILSCLGFLVHAYVSFRTRELQFALLRTVGFSMRQLVTMVWFEQLLVIAVGLTLGTWMGGRLGKIIMPFLGHDDWGDRVIPPFVTVIDWGTLLVTYAVMVTVFATIILAMMWFIQRISLQRMLKLGEM